MIISIWKKAKYEQKELDKIIKNVSRETLEGSIDDI